MNDPTLASECEACRTMKRRGHRSYRTVPTASLPTGNRTHRTVEERPFRAA